MSAARKAGAGVAFAGVTASALRALRWRTRADLRGCGALVTGGSRGLGLLIARELGRCGCRVAICARDGEELERAARRLAGDVSEVVTLTGDVGDRDQARDLVARAAQRLRRLDVVVNNAGVIQVGPYGRQTEENMRQAMDVMFWGPYHVTAAAVPYLERAGHGRVINITSIGGRISVPHLLPYSCAKFAATGLSAGLHAELAARGVRVMTVTPGLMRTGSQLNATFTGDAEYVWFGLSASLPLISMDAERAARRIVTASRENRAHLTLTPVARLGAMAEGVAPGLTARAMAVADRVLPSGEDTGATTTRGRAADDRLGSPVFAMATRLGRAAARRFNQ